MQRDEKKKCELQIETSWTIEASIYRFTDLQIKAKTLKQKKRGLAADDGNGRIIEANVNDGWTGEARLAEEEEALSKIVAKM